MMRADLHSHTLYSDGALSVEDLIQRAKSKGLDIIAITDHDTLVGSKYACEVAEDYDMTAIYGMELSTERNNESIHILCYFSKPNLGEGLFTKLEKQRLDRKTRALEVAKLLKIHFNLDLDTKFIEEKHSITRGTIANEIIRQGLAKDKKEVFSKMIGDDCPAFIPSTKLTTEEGIKLIKENNGLCVLAHPCLYKKNDIEDLIKLGVDGIEVVYPSVENREQKYRDLAKKYNLIVTGGSDFHSINDYKHGDVGDCYIKDEDLRKFLRVLENEH